MKKIAFLLLSLVILSGCMQSTAMLGPALTAATTGNVMQASISYGTNLTIKEKTGKTPSEHMIEYKTKKKIEKDLKKLVKQHIQLTRNKISRITKN